MAAAFGRCCAETNVACFKSIKRAAEYRQANGCRGGWWGVPLIHWPAEALRLSVNQGRSGRAVGGIPSVLYCRRGACWVNTAPLSKINKKTTQRGGFGAQQMHISQNTFRFSAQTHNFLSRFCSFIKLVSRFSAVFYESIDSLTRSCLFFKNVEPRYDEYLIPMA